MHPFIEEMTWRGMIHDVMPGLDEQLSKEPTAAYIGFDPTADSIHIGSLSTLMLLKHFQLAGHKPYILVGGATGMIGDPSGKTEERKLLSEETLKHNIKKMTVELSAILDFDCGQTSAVVVNNYDWFKDWNFLSFMRDIGKHISVNYMMAKDSVKKRLETGISFTEFTYQLVQGYDFLHLYENYDIKLQMGGSDQWGNITTGTEMIRKKAKGTAFALTAPLITKSDGSKFGKSEGGNIWLDPEKTSPYKFYQFWLNVGDDEAVTLLKRFTLLSKDEIDALENTFEQTQQTRFLQKKLAEEVTRFIHGEHALKTAIKASTILFGKSSLEDLKGLDKRTFIQVFEGEPNIEISKKVFEETEDLINLFSDTTQNIVFKSKGEARKMLKGGGLSVNKTKVNMNDSIKSIELIHGKFLVLQRGKKNHFLVKLI